VARATERGGGVALMPELICKPWFERGALVRIDGFDHAAEEAYYLVARHEDIERPEVRAFTQWLIDQFQVAA
jgi:DNA-binding transcriptional LysR family regulator